MIYIFAILVIWLAYCIITAPEGYQRDGWFYYGKEKRK